MHVEGHRCSWVMRRATGSGSRRRWRRRGVCHTHVCSRVAPTVHPGERPRARVHPHACMLQGQAKGACACQCSDLIAAVHMQSSERSAFCQVQPLYRLLYTRCYWCRLWVMLPCPCRYARRCPQRPALLHVLDVWSARLAACTPGSRRMSCVDVCVPSYRVQPDMLEGIIDTCLADM